MLQKTKVMHLKKRKSTACSASSEHWIKGPFYLKRNWIGAPTLKKTPWLIMKDKIKSEVLSKKIKNTWKQSFLKEKSN